MRRGEKKSAWAKDESCAEKTRSAVAVGETTGLLLLLLSLNVGCLLWPLLTGALLDRHIKTGMQTDVLLLRYIADPPPHPPMVNVNEHRSSRQTDVIEEGHVIKDERADVRGGLNGYTKATTCLIVWNLISLYMEVKYGLQNKFYIFNHICKQHKLVLAGALFPSSVHEQKVFKDIKYNRRTCLK